MKTDEEKFAEQWFQVAEDDLKSCQYLLESQIYRNVCFLSQQAVEKYIKGLLALKNIEFYKTHDLIELNRILKDNNIELNISQKNLQTLNVLYIEARYPDAYFEIYSKDDAEHALNTAKIIISEVKKFTN